MIDAEKKIIQEAILNEVEGAQFYRMAAMQAPTQEAIESLNKLAEEEVHHIEFLKKLAEEMSGGEITVDEALEAEIPSPDIYNWGKLDKQSLSLGLSVFSIGMQMERESIAFYQNAKKEISDEKAKNVFDILIRWEEAHLNQFSKQYELYKQEWWADQGYSPI